MKKQDVCVYIENKAQLKEARELLDKYGEKIDEKTFYVGVSRGNNLYYSKHSSDWGLGYIKKINVTLSELEEILKAENL